MRVVIYARVSTVDKDQDPETQLFPLREFVASHEGWTMGEEFVDQASATDLKGRKEWRRLLEAASRHKFDLLLVWRLDRAFRSVLDAATTLERLRGWGVGLRSYSEPWLDTTSPFGEALYYITVAYAQLERGILRERVRAGMDRARRQGKHVGRPHKVNGEWDRIRPLLMTGTMSRAEAVQVLGVSRATVSRLLAQKGGHLGASESRENQGSPA